MDDVAAPFGSFMEAMPHWAFIIIHSALVLVGFWLARKTKLNGFLLFVVAELSYITYHAGLTHFLFAHIVAEVCDALALVTIALALGKRVGIPGAAPFVAGAAQHRSRRGARQTGGGCRAPGPRGTLDPPGCCRACSPAPR